MRTQASSGTAARRAPDSSKRIETPLAPKKIEFLTDEAHRLLETIKLPTDSSVIRQERVDVLRAALLKGDYQPSSSDIAASLLQDVLAIRGR